MLIVFVPFDEIALAVSVGLLTAFLEGLGILPELGPDFLQQVAELFHLLSV